MHDIDWKSKRNQRAKIKSFIRRFLLFPEFWDDADKNLQTDLEWKFVEFTEQNSRIISNRNGIYGFVVTPKYSCQSFFKTSYLLYIGKASSISLKNRYKMYLNEMKGIGVGDQKPRIKVQEMLNDYYGHIYFYYAEINNKELIEECETKLLNTFVPYVNTHIPEAQINPHYKHIY